MKATLGFGRRIEKAIADRGSHLGRRYTNKEFGIEIGIAERGKAYSQQAVSDWLAERNEPSLSTFLAMSSIVGKSPAWLMAVDAVKGVNAPEAHQRSAEAVHEAISENQLPDMPGETFEPLATPSARKDRKAK